MASVPNAQGKILWRDLKTGLFFLFGLALMGWLGFYIGKNTGLLTPHHTVKVFVPDIKGLNEGNFVGISGKKVGTVRTMQFVERNDTNGILLTLDIMGDEYFSLIRKDSKATIRSMGVLGDKLVDITLGHSKELLADGGTLQLAVEPGLEDLTASAIKTMKNVGAITDRIEQGEGTLGKIITTNELNDKVESAIAGLTSLEAKLTSGNGLAPKLLNDGAMAQKVDETLKNLNEITSSLKQGNGSVGKFVMGDEFLTKLSGVTSRTDSLITMLSDSRGSLAKFSRDPAVYDNLNTSILTMQESIKHLDSLFVDLKKNPGRYVHVSVF